MPVALSCIGRILDGAERAGFPRGPLHFGSARSLRRARRSRARRTGRMQRRRRTTSGPFCLCIIGAHFSAR
ncbi:hypothetical protein XM57_01305 [Burkholderia cepacia]|nr:hypothetical protein XM57_01305 [Burkholderia cepacia]ETP61463.1 hypothetical protein BDSB_27350 [Burkholderia dolosa PC543]